MTSSVTNSLPMTSVEGPHFHSTNLTPSILLSPNNLSVAGNWCDKQDNGYISRTAKQDKISITEKLKKVFRKKDRISHSSDRPFRAPKVEGHRHSDTYFPAISDIARAHQSSASKDAHRHSEIYSPNNEVLFKAQRLNGIQADEQMNISQPLQREENIQQTDSTQSGTNVISAKQESHNNFEIPFRSSNLETEKKSGSLLNLSKGGRLKTSLQMFTKTFKKTKHRDRYLSECPSINESDGVLLKSSENYFHYNTVNADDYKEIFQKFPGEKLSKPRNVTAVVQSTPLDNGSKHKTLQPAVGKKNRFVVSSAAREASSNGRLDHLGSDRRPQKTTMMAQLLKSPDENKSYNTVGPLDNRDRRPSVTLNDFLQMYKEKNGVRKDVKAERKRSISQSETESCAHHQQPPSRPPIITLTSDDRGGEETCIISEMQHFCACAQESVQGQGSDLPNQADKVGEEFKQNSIPEHQEVHHETSPRAFSPPEKKNRFLNVNAIRASEAASLSSSYRRPCNSAESSPFLDPRKMSPLPAYDHSLTVSGYPRRTSKLTTRKTSSRRLSEPNQQWPELKNSNTTKANEMTTRYRKVPANSLGIDIPTDEFHNKLLVWIDKKRGTKILPLPHEEHDVWSGNRDENSSICFLAKRYKCCNVMPVSGKLVLFDSELPVQAAFEAFTFNRVRSAPVWDSKKKQLTGMLTVSDFIEVLLVCANHPELFEKITDQKISDWKSLINKTKFEANKSLECSGDDDFDSKEEARPENSLEDTNVTSPDENQTSSDSITYDFSSSPTSTPEVFKTDDPPRCPPQGPSGEPVEGLCLSSHPRRRSRETNSVSFDTGLISVESDDSLYDAISVLRTFGFHRILVMDYTDNDPLYIITYKRILYFIYVMMDTINIPPFMGSSISDLNVGTFSNLVTIKYDTTLKEALSLLQWRSVSAIPVLEDDGKVVDLYTKEDVMNLVYNNKFTQLDSTIKEILHDKRRIFEGLFKCNKSDSLMAVVQYFISSKAHRLVVTSDDNRLEGIISLSDVVNFMVLGSKSDNEDTTHC